MAEVTPPEDDRLDFNEVMEHSRSIAMNALERVHFQRSGVPFVICDYGTGDGKNVIDVMKEFIACIKTKYGKEQQVLIVFEDLPQNNFTGLFTGFHGDETGPRRYSFGYDDVAVMAVGRSFYSQCTPAGFVHLGFSLRAMQRLSVSPCTLSDGLMSMYASSELERKRFSDQAARDWETLLLQRAKELAPGGQVIFALDADTDERDFYIDKGGICHSYSLLNKTWRKMVDLGRISEVEFRNTNVNSYLRTAKELKEPFVRPGSPVLNAGLKLVDLFTKYAPTHLEEQRKRCETNDDGDPSMKAIYASRKVNLTRLWFGRSLFDGLSTDRPTDQRTALLDECFSMFRDSIAISPQKYTLARYIAVIHMEKGQV